MTEQAACAGNERKLKIFIVEDDEINAMVFIDLLQSEGFNVTRASTGEEALKYLTTQDFDIALIDINLGYGSIDGVEVLRRYKAFTKDPIPTVAVTAFAMLKDKEKFLKEGFNTYMPKPVFIGDLLKTIDSFGLHKNLKSVSKSEAKS